MAGRASQMRMAENRDPDLDPKVVARWLRKNYMSYELADKLDPPKEGMRP